jgi:hypothetical protein
VSCDKSTESEKTYRVGYLVFPTPSSIILEITYVKSGGGTETIAHEGLWEHSFQAASGTSLSVTAGPTTAFQNVHYSVYANIEVEGFDTDVTQMVGSVGATCTVSYTIP